MNNVTYNGNKLKRIYVNDNLADNIKYNNNTIVGYRATNTIGENCYNIISGSNYEVTNNSLIVNQVGSLEVKTKFITNGFRFYFQIPNTLAIVDFDIKINTKFSIHIGFQNELYNRTNVNGTIYDGKVPETIYSVDNTIILRFTDGTLLTFNLTHGNKENAYGYVKISTTVRDTQNSRGLTGYFRVCDQYPVE